MKIAGIIAEYNPFHSGHAYHIAKTREHCDYVVVCMTGSYTQRGEAACLSKWDRAAMALTCGADAVFELPALFAVRSADAFARGGVGILDGLGADILSFGSETQDVHLLRQLAQLRQDEPAEVSDQIRQGLQEGKSHARAWGEAAAKWLGVPKEMLDAPNTILAAEYIRALTEGDSAMEILPIVRQGSYHDEHPQENEFASATAVRAALKEGRMQDALRWTPDAVKDYLSNAPRMHEPDDLLLYRLRSMSEAEIADLPDAAEGLEHRVKRAAEQAGTVGEFIELVKCKRYTRARLLRLAAHALLGITKEMTLRHPVPEYARLIGMRTDARDLLGELKRRSTLPIVSNPTQLRGSEIFELDVRATELRALQCDGSEQRRAGQEYTHPFVKIR